MMTAVVRLPQNLGIFFKFCVCRVILLKSGPDISEDYHISQLSSPADYQKFSSYFYPWSVLHDIVRSSHVMSTHGLMLRGERTVYWSICKCPLL